MAKLRFAQCIIFALSTVCIQTSANCQEITAPKLNWSGERRALSRTERFSTYHAVGQITCHRPAISDSAEEYFHGTGQLTISNDVVTTALHNLINPKTCMPYAAPWNCVFSMEGGRSYEIDMPRSKFGSSMNAKDWSGSTPENCKTEKSAFAKDDWAVLKLKTNVADAVPFQIDEMTRKDIENIGSPVKKIAGYTASFLKDGHQTSSIELCHQQGPSPRGGTRDQPLLLADCGGGPGTSGAGLYREGASGPGSEHLVAIYHGPLLLPGKRPSLYIPLSGAFIKQIYLAK
jgi:hypothetical protein